MADPPRSPDTGDDTGDDTGVEPDRGSPPRMPRWVKVFGIILAALILLVVIVTVTGVGGSDHGPGRHTGGGDSAPASVTEVHALPKAAHG